MTTWPRSILPEARDARWNWLATAIAPLYRDLWDGEQIVTLSMVVRGRDGERTVRYPGDGAEAGAGLETDRDEEKVC